MSISTLNWPEFSLEYGSKSDRTPTMSARRLCAILWSGAVDYSTVTLLARLRG